MERPPNPRSLHSGRDDDGGGRADAWRDRFVATLACHSSVRAGMRLTPDEGRALVRQLERAEQPHTCPHGRPTMIHTTATDLARGFHRR